MAFREEASREAENETGSGNCDESAGRVVVGKYRLEHVRWGIEESIIRARREDKEIIKESVPISPLISHSRTVECPNCPNR